MSHSFKTSLGFSDDDGFMSAHDVFPEACATITPVVRKASDADLDLSTPCSDYDLRALVDHFAGTTGALARAGAQQPLDAADPWGSTTRVADGDWAATLTANLQAMADGWSQPQAWQGSVDTGGGEMPARSVGDMALIEVMVHGWDLARATGQELEVSPDLGAEVRRLVEETADLGRQMEAYGPAVEVSPDASDFERALAAAGRDPGWSA